MFNLDAFINYFEQKKKFIYCKNKLLRKNRRFFILILKFKVRKSWELSNLYLYVSKLTNRQEVSYKFYLFY